MSQFSLTPARESKRRWEQRTLSYAVENTERTTKLVFHAGEHISVACLCRVPSAPMESNQSFLGML